MLSSPRRRGSASQPWAALAQQVGLDSEGFAACLDDGRQQREVQTDAALAAAHGINTTPSFVVGRLVEGEFVGKTFAGALSFDDFARQIDALLQ